MATGSPSWTPQSRSSSRDTVTKSYCMSIPFCQGGLHRDKGVQEGRVVEADADRLDADGQPVRPPPGRNVRRGKTEQRPRPPHDRVAGVIQALRGHAQRTGRHAQLTPPPHAPPPPPPPPPTPH